MRDMSRYKLGFNPQTQEAPPEEDKDALIDKLMNVANDHYVSNIDKPMCGISGVHEALSFLTDDQKLIRLAMRKSHYGQDSTFNLEGLFSLF